jgi:calcineurin-like phosphoesterase family protein
MTRTWFTSDLHFGHANILEYEPKRKEILGSSIDEHDAALIARINSCVKPGDTLYLLGDLGMYGRVVPCVKQLNGTKIMIKGNHDKESNGKLCQAGIMLVLEEAIIKVGKHRIRLSHYPYRESWLRSFIRQIKKTVLRHTDKRPHNDGKWLLHGHIHSRGNTIPFNKQIHIGVDTHNYKPWSLEEILAVIEGDQKP